MAICVKLPGSQAKKSGLRTGKYSSRALSVEWAEEYCTGKAIRISYELTSESGAKHDFSEVFYNDPRNERTSEFFDYLEENGVSLDAIDEFVGCKEELVLKRSTKGRFLTIDQRTFIGGPDE